MRLRLNPYLVLNGNTREAVQFYAQALGAEVIGVQTFGEMPADPNHPVPEDLKDRVLHAALKVGETELMMSDTMPGMEHQIGTNVTIAIVTDDTDRAKAMYEGLLEGGQIVMPLQETFWSPAYGQIVDKFGVFFHISVER